MAPEVLIPILAVTVGLGMGGSLNHPRHQVFLTPILVMIVIVIYPAVIGAAIAGRAFREILAPRSLSWFELGAVIVAGIGVPIGVMAFFRAWEPLAAWILGSGLLFYWHWLSSRAAGPVHYLREMAGALLLAPLPLFFAWTIITRKFFPDLEIGLAMLIFWLPVLGANLGRAWYETGRPGAPGVSSSGRAAWIIAIFVFSFVLLFLGIHEEIFRPPRMPFLQYGGIIAYVFGVFILVLGLRGIFLNPGGNKFIKYILYGATPIILFAFYYAYQGRGLSLR
ncbi:MAG: hypothetical protein PHE84_03650 [bacterium]|nr:hypothetical protein [bacterium]